MTALSGALVMRDWSSVFSVAPALFYCTCFVPCLSLFLAQHCDAAVAVHLQLSHELRLFVLQGWDAHRISIRQ